MSYGKNAGEAANAHAWNAECCRQAALRQNPELRCSQSSEQFCHVGLDFYLLCLDGFRAMTCFPSHYQFSMSRTYDVGPADGTDAQ